MAFESCTTGRHKPQPHATTDDTIPDVQLNYKLQQLSAVGISSLSAVWQRCIGRFRGDQREGKASRKRPVASSFAEGTELVLWWEFQLISSINPLGTSWKGVGVEQNFWAKLLAEFEVLDCTSRSTNRTSDGKCANTLGLNSVFAKLNIIGITPEWS